MKVTWCKYVFNVTCQQAEVVQLTTETDTHGLKVTKSQTCGS